MYQLGSTIVLAKSSLKTLVSIKWSQHVLANEGPLRKLLVCIKRSQHLSWQKKVLFENF